MLFKYCQRVQTKQTLVWQDVTRRVGEVYRISDHDGQVIYVGRTTFGYRVRLEAHRRRFGDEIAKLEMAVVPMDDLVIVEGQLIHHYHPRHNNQCVPGCSYYVNYWMVRRPRPTKLSVMAEIRKDVYDIVTEYYSSTGEYFIPSRVLAQLLLETEDKSLYSRRTIFAVQCVVRDALVPVGAYTEQRNRVRGYVVDEVRRRLLSCDSGKDKVLG